MKLKGEEKKYHIFKKRLIVIIITLLFFSFVSAGVYVFVLNKPACGDGTDYNECSERQPYFCEQGILVEKTSLCGCPENLTVEEDSCVSEYQTGVKNIFLDYILRGENEKIDFVVYRGLASYLSKLPRSIHHTNGEVPTKVDFKLKKLDEEQQRYSLIQLVTEIQNSADNEKDRIRIAISLVQNIPFGDFQKTTKIGGIELDYARYPYEVLYDEQGFCGEKSELLAFILREMGYGVAFFYYPAENHEAIAVKCPKRHSVGRTGYCLIETTGPSIMTDEGIEYLGVGQLSSEPEVIVVSDGKSIGGWWYEFRDANYLNRIRNSMKRNGMIGALRYNKFEKLNEKYGLEENYNI